MENADEIVIKINIKVNMFFKELKICILKFLGRS